jgi:hypothetical protein
MYALLYRIGRWLLQKLTVVGVIVVGGVLLLAVVLYFQEQVDDEQRREEWRAELAGQHEALLERRAALEAAWEEKQAELAKQRARAEQAQRLLHNLQQLRGWWDRWFGDAAQQAQEEARAARVREIQREAEVRQGVLHQELEINRAEQDALARELAWSEERLAAAAPLEPGPVSWLRRAWERSRYYILFAVAAYLLGPTVVKLIAYYVIAPLLSRGRPIRLHDGELPGVEVGASSVSVATALAPDEVLRVREKYLQASDESLARRTRFVLDWRIPFTSAACGLIELIELRPAQPATSPGQVTFSTLEDPHTELAVITMPEHAALILRPSFLAGVITRVDEPLRIRRRWIFGRWQSWVTLQFRFFEFLGPCRLVVAGRRGVRAEYLVGSRPGAWQPARRANRLGTIGFTPELDYLPVRAETFWSYYRGMNPLFDDLFAGRGMFLQQETAGGDGPGQADSFWAGLWNGLLKVFGL